LSMVAVVENKVDLSMVVVVVEVDSTLEVLALGIVDFDCNKEVAVIDCTLAVVIDCSLAAVVDYTLVVEIDGTLAVVIVEMMTDHQAYVSHECGQHHLLFLFYKQEFSNIFLLLVELVKSDFDTVALPIESSNPKSSSVNVKRISLAELEGILKLNVSFQLGDKSFLMERVRTFFPPNSIVK